MKCLKLQLQDDGFLSITAFEPGMQTWEENHVEQFFDELTGAPLDPEQVRLAKIKEG